MTVSELLLLRRSAGPARLPAANCKVLQPQPGAAAAGTRRHGVTLPRHSLGPSPALYTAQALSAAALPRAAALQALESIPPTPRLSAPSTPPRRHRPPLCPPARRPMASPAATPLKLRLLADALALDFSQSLASAQCAAALEQLLPGLEYLRCGCDVPYSRACCLSKLSMLGRIAWPDSVLRPACRGGVEGRSLVPGR